MDTRYTLYSQSDKDELGFGGLSFQDDEDFSMYDNVPIKEHYHKPDFSNVIKGLKKFVEDYRSAMDAGNINLAMEIRDNIKKDMDLHKLPKDIRWEIWGENPDKV